MDLLANQKTPCIDQEKTLIRQATQSRHLVSSHSWQRMNKGFFLFQESIEEGGFSHIRESDYGNLDLLLHRIILPILEPGIPILFGDNIIYRLERTGQVDVSSQSLFFSPVDQDKHLLDRFQIIGKRIYDRIDCDHFSRRTG